MKGAEEVLRFWKLRVFFLFVGFLNFLKHITGGSQQNKRTTQHLNWLPIDLHPVFKWDPFCCCWPLLWVVYLSLENPPHPKFWMKIWMSVPIDPPIPSLSKEARVSRSTTWTHKHIRLAWLPLECGHKL